MQLFTTILLKHFAMLSELFIFLHSISYFYMNTDRKAFFSLVPD